MEQRIENGAQGEMSTEEEGRVKWRNDSRDRKENIGEEGRLYHFTSRHTAKISIPQLVWLPAHEIQFPLGILMRPHPKRGAGRAGAGW